MEQNNRAILVNVATGKDENVFEELERLADTAGYEVVATLSQNRERPDKTYHLGKGKAEELKELAASMEAGIVIFDNELSGTQFFNLETLLGISVIDRSTLILEIFSRHATSNEGKLQVELAQKRKMLPRILGQGTVLSRQGGGGGGGGGARRGGGEQQLELDRRTIRKEISELEERIEQLAKERELRRSRREKNRVKSVSIVGYTNAGKSTLMNAMTKAGVLEEDKLFATLDPVSRKIWMDIGKEFLLTDTVGFISRLPHELIKAFRSTLEETKYADLILHIVDSSSEEALSQYDVVNEVLASIGVDEKIPVIVALNKIDLGTMEVIPDTKHLCRISAKTGEGIEKLKEMISDILFGE